VLNFFSAKFFCRIPLFPSPTSPDSFLSVHKNMSDEKRDISKGMEYVKQAEAVLKVHTCAPVDVSCANVPNRANRVLVVCLAEQKISFFYSVNALVVNVRDSLADSLIAGAGQSKGGRH
jgi:hypothetical protein